MRVARSHGVDIPSTIMDISQDEQDLDLVTQHYIGRDDVGDVSWMHFSTAILLPLFD